MKMTLVVMAAGLGSRYGGDKQIDGVGPHNEILMEYGIWDALRAGFDRIVFIIKPDMVDLMDRLCGDYLRCRKTRAGEPVDVIYAVQDFSSLPGWYTIPAERTKPYGTVHALLCAKDAVPGPCCVINADDYYGSDAYQTMYDALTQLPEQGRALMVGYYLKNTVSRHGAVSRGVCRAKDGRLEQVTETKKIQLLPDGAIYAMEQDALLDPESVVSMNFWGFAPTIFPVLEAYLENFLQGDGGKNITSECLLPVMVDDLIASKQMEVTVMESAGKWFGMTYREDRAAVSEELKRLHEGGVYPESLREACAW